jgi:hypothetical protein
MGKKPSFLFNTSSVTSHRSITPDNPMAWDKKKYRVLAYTIGNSTDGFDIS